MKYTVHLVIDAPSDEMARFEADRIASHVGVREFYVTDADDWSEHLNQLCACGQPTVDGLREGRGQRLCQKCADTSPWGVYPIPGRTS